MLDHSHLERDLLDMTESQKLNHVLWELAVAVGYSVEAVAIPGFMPSDGLTGTITVNLNELLARAVELIEAGHKYEGLDH